MGAMGVMGVMGGLTAAVDALCEVDPSKVDGGRAAPGARTAGGGGDPGRGRLRRRGGVGGGRGPDVGRLAGGALRFAGGRRPAASGPWPPAAVDGGGGEGVAGRRHRPGPGGAPGGGPHRAHGILFRAGRGPARRPGQGPALPPLRTGIGLLEPARRSRRGGGRRRRPTGGPPAAPVEQLRGVLVPRRGVGSHLGGGGVAGAAQHRGGAVRRRLGRGQGPGGRRCLRGRRVRTPAQRRADALVEMARRAMSTPRVTAAGAVVHRPRGLRDPRRSDMPAGQRHRGHARFAVAVARRGVGGAGRLRRPRSGRQRGRTSADVPGRHPRAVEVRDRECFHPYCDATVEDCQVDHLQPWAFGGLTVDDNGRLACAFHNQLRHQARPPP